MAFHVLWMFNIWTKEMHEYVLFVPKNMLKDFVKKTNCVYLLTIYFYYNRKETHLWGLW